MTTPSPERDGGREVIVRLEGFALEEIDRESARMGVSAQELIAFAAMYYLADVDSGRIARVPPNATSDRVT